MTTKTPNTPTTRPRWLPDDAYPFRLRSIDLGDETVAYIDEGEGPTLLFVHTGMWSFIFRDVILRLRDDFRCVALDFPGYGLSPEPRAGDLDRITKLIPRMTATKVGVGRHLDRADKRAFLGPFRDRRRVGRFHTLMRDALVADDLYARIEAATTGVLGGLPVLTIFGEKNDPFGFQDRHHATFPDHEGHIVTNGNHFPMMDDPDLFADAIRDWWRRNNDAA